MSLSKVSEVGNLGDDFKGLTLQQIKDKICEKFYVVYGRYENVSGTMWVEVYHKGSEDYSQGEVIWRKGTINKSELDEDEILTREVAIPKFIDLINKGYSLEFKAVTQSDMDTQNALRIEQQSTLKREGWLGIYYRGDSFFRISQFKKDEYYIEQGYDGVTINTSFETEAGAKYELDMALSEGFRREGIEEAILVNPLEAFGLVLDTIETQKAIPAEGDLPSDFFELMS